jgi:hypothetical protein
MKGQFSSLTAAFNVNPSYAEKHSWDKHPMDLPHVDRMVTAYALQVANLEVWI